MSAHETRCRTGATGRWRVVAVVAAAVGTLLVTGVAPAGAEHEIPWGWASYSDGTTSKTATPGTTLTLNATFGRADGVYGGVGGDFVWWITVGKPYVTAEGKYIPCYQGFRFVDRVNHYVVNNRISNASFVVPALAPGQWEVCFYSQPFQYATYPVLLNVP